MAPDDAAGVAIAIALDVAFAVALGDAFAVALGDTTAGEGAGAGGGGTELTVTEAVCVFTQPDVVPVTVDFNKRVRIFLLLLTGKNENATA